MRSNAKMWSVRSKSRFKASKKKRAVCDEERRSATAPKPRDRYR